MVQSRISHLSRLAHDAAASVPDIPAEIAATIRWAAAGPADPWLLIGVLIEGIVHTTATAIPLQRRTDCAAAVLELALDRMRVCVSAVLG
jgi:hypothetical protein